MSILQVVIGAVALTAVSATMQWTEKPIQFGDLRYNVTPAKNVLYNGMYYPVTYQTIQRSGDSHGSVFGSVVDSSGAVIVSPQTGSSLSDNADFTSLLDFGLGSTLFSISHFESPQPASAYLTKLNQDNVTGLLTAVSTKPISFLTVGGLMDPCAGSVTPWMTHLGSEETDPNARTFADATLATLQADSDVLAYLLYFGVGISNPASLTMDTIKANYKPYYYGWMWEATVDPVKESATVVKHYAMGRSSWEQTVTMPDLKTVYMTADGGSNHGLYKFIASTPSDLSSGCLYFLKLTQLSATNGGTFNMAWSPISANPAVACTTDAAIKPMLSKSFYDIFSAAAPLDAVAGTCPTGYTPVNVGTFECLMVKPGMELAASRMETARYAAMQGASLEFNKLEGITYDTKRNTLYASVTSVAYSMEDNAAAGVKTTKYDLGTKNAIRLPYNPCGVVYAIALKADTYDAYSMSALIVGKVNPTYTGPIPAADMTVANENTQEDRSLSKNNMCALQGIANPDNLAYAPKHDGLFIAEDSTTGHQNDVLWYYSFGAGSLVRVLGTPFGSEVTSAYFYPDINGFTYIMAVIQHPYGESDEYRVNDPLAVANGGARCYVGYMAQTVGQIITGQYGIPFPTWSTVCDPNKYFYGSCVDDDPCTDDFCDGGVCAHLAVEPCTPCKGLFDPVCDDGAPCTQDLCKYGICRHYRNNVNKGKVCATGKVCNKRGYCAPPFVPN